MPIDYQSQLSSADENLRNLLAQRKSTLEDRLGSMSGNIGALRSQFESQAYHPLVQQTLSRFGLSPTNVPLQHTQGLLESQLQKQMDSYRLSQQRQTQGLQLGELNRLSDREFQNLMASQQYGRQFGNLVQGQEFSSTEADKQRAFQEQMDTLQQEYANRSLLQSQQYQQPDPYQSALAYAISSLLGTGVGAFAGAQYGYKGYRQPQVNTGQTYSP